MTYIALLDLDSFRSKYDVVDLHSAEYFASCKVVLMYALKKLATLGIDQIFIQLRHIESIRLKCIEIFLPRNGVDVASVSHQTGAHVAAAWTGRLSAAGSVAGGQAGEGAYLELSILDPNVTDEGTPAALFWRIVIK